MTQRVLRTFILIGLIGIAATVGSHVTIGAQQQVAAANLGSLFKAYPVQGNIWLIPEPAANVIVSLGRDGIMLVDSGTADNANKMLATAKQLANDVIARPQPFTPCVGPNCAANRYAYGYYSPSFDGITASVAPAKIGRAHV